MISNVNEAVTLAIFMEITTSTQSLRRRCAATTQKGQHCKRKPAIGDLCRQHAKFKPTSTPISTTTPEQVITVTFCEAAENHVGMQQIGTSASCGFTLEEIESAKNFYEQAGCECELIDLRDQLPPPVVKSNPNIQSAPLLIIRGGVAACLDSNRNQINLNQEMSDLKWDTKAFMYGRVVNKRKRHNLCFADSAQEPDYEEGKGRIIDFKSVPLLQTLRSSLRKSLGRSADNLVAEGNCYYDIIKCGIGFHGDAERRRVVGVRLGSGSSSMPLVYCWYRSSSPVSSIIRFDLNDGDMYIMGDKTVGWDWRRSSQYTLRHAAGCDASITV